MTGKAIAALLATAALMPAQALASGTYHDPVAGEADQPSTEPIFEEPDFGEIAPEASGPAMEEPAEWDSAITVWKKVYRWDNMTCVVYYDWHGTMTGYSCFAGRPAWR